MKRLRWILAVVPVAFAFPAAAEPTAEALVARMRAARQSEGFEARIKVVAVAPDGRRAEPLKLAVVGQFGAARQRVLVRGIAPDEVRDRRLFVELDADGHIRAVGQHGEMPAADANPHARILDSGLVAWDMLAPWWHWSRQSLGGSDRVAGRECTLVLSRNDAADAPIREVRSCVDSDGGLSLRTEFFDSRRALVRVLTVTATMRKESGLLAAKKIAVTAGKTLTEAEVYSGDEHYDVAAETFAPLEQPPATSR